MAVNFEKDFGKKIKSVSLSENKNKLTLEFQDGTKRRLGVDGDCCSKSWIEHLELPGHVDGAVLTGVDENGEDETENDALNPKRGGDDERYRDRREHECLQVYQTVLHTNRGDITLEYRNSSNGFYGGYLVDLDGLN